MMTWPDFSYKQIVVHQTRNKGEKIRFRADNIVILDCDGKVLLQHTCHRLFALFVIGEISMTSVLLRNSVKYGFPIILMNGNLRVVARFNCAADGNTLLRIRQYGFAEKSLDVAKELIRQKIANQISLIKSLRRLSEDNVDAISCLKKLDVQNVSNIRELMGIEGNASRVFFKSYFSPVGWSRREPRCKRDIYNVLLDIGYTLIFQFVEAMLSLYGFDLYCGVFHAFFYQRKSLVCDIVEPFRSIIDRRIRKAHNLGQIDKSDFYVRNGMYMLEWDAQSKYIRLFLKDILERKEEIFKYCQQYYRWVMRDRPICEFPKFCVVEG
jgi:CRISPR-associated protein Cas1